MRDGMRTAGEFCAAATKIIEAAKNSAHKNTLTATLNDMVRWPVSATIASWRKRPEPLRGKRGTITQLVCVRQEQRAGKGSIDAGYVGKFRQGRVWPRSSNRLPALLSRCGGSFRPDPLDQDFRLDAACHAWLPNVTGRKQ